MPALAKRRSEEEHTDCQSLCCAFLPSFETFAVSFSKFVGNQPDTQWLKTGDEFVEVAVYVQRSRQTSWTRAFSAKKATARRLSFVQVQRARLLHDDE